MEKRHVLLESDVLFRRRSGPSLDFPEHRIAALREDGVVRLRRIRSGEEGKQEDRRK